MNEKHKHQHTLPDRQLARAFGFSAADLASNRAGFVSRAQIWGIPLALRPLFLWLEDTLLVRIAGNRQLPRCLHVCDRAQLDYRQWQIRSLFHADFVERYTLEIGDRRFVLTAAQYRCIAGHVAYHVYYLPESQQILSLERATKDCGEI